MKYIQCKIMLVLWKIITMDELTTLVNICKSCGEDTMYSDLCTDCRSRKYQDREQQLFDKAEKIKSSDYDGPVYWENHIGSFGDGYFATLAEVIDYCESENMELPKYVYACESVPFNLNAHQIIENELESQDMFEDAYDHLGGNEAADELQTLLDGWLKKHEVSSVFADFKCAVIIKND